MMRMPTLEGRDRRAVLLGAAVLGPALLWAFAVGPYVRAVADATDRLAVERRLLRGELELMASASTYPAAFDAGAERLLAAAERLMAGEDEGAAAAALAGYVRRLAQSSGASLTRVEPAASRDAGGGVRGLPVGVTGETDLEGLMTLLQLLESGPKLIHVEELRLEAAGGGAQPQAGGGAAYAAATPFYATAPGGQPEVITFRFTATAFTLAAPADTASTDAGQADDGPADPVSAEDGPADDGPAPAEDGGAAEELRGADGGTP